MRYLLIQSDGSAEVQGTFDEVDDAEAVSDGDLQLFKIENEKVWQASAELVENPDDPEQEDVVAITWHPL